MEDVLKCKCVALKAREGAGVTSRCVPRRCVPVHPGNNAYKFLITCIVMYSNSTAFL